jgi:heat shock protein HslJ
MSGKIRFEGCPRALVLIATAVLAACAGPRRPDQARAAGVPDSAAPMGDTAAAPAADSAAALEGTDWRLVELGGAPVARQERNHPGFRLVAEGRKVQGSAGCNRMMGSYTLQGTTLKFGPLASTRMACPRMEIETKFLAALHATTRYELAERNLTLYGGDAPLARLEAAAETGKAGP